MTSPNVAALFHIENAQTLLSCATISGSTDVELDEIRAHLNAAIAQLKNEKVL